MDWSLIEEWLDRHPDQAHHYFMKVADVPLVNKWLQARGYLRIPEAVNGGMKGCSGHRLSPAPRYSSDRSRDPSPCSPASPRERASTESVVFFGDEVETHHKRTNSRKCLRHEYARAKSRSVVKVEESSCSRPRESSDCHLKRIGLKQMRKSVSLPPSSIGLLSLLIESKVQLPRFASKHRDLKRELRKRDETAFFLDIVKDIANDLDLRSLTRKVKDNLTVLLECDAASLFLVEEGKGRGRPTLISKVFDVRCGAKGAVIPKHEGSESEVRLPWGAGVIGDVAETGETVNLEAPCEDSRYCDAVDRLTGYHVDSLLCMPIRNAEDDVIAVAQVVNKMGQEGRFTQHDEKLLETYLQFVSIAITNAKIMEASRREYERNRNLLEAVHELFDKQTSLEALIQKTLQEAHRLLACEKAAILLLKHEQETGVRFTKAFEVNSNVKKKVKIIPDARTLEEPLLEIAQQVAANGEIVTSPEPNSSSVSPPSPVVAEQPPSLRSVLAMPIRNTKLEVIGVAMLINKLGMQGFDDYDEQLFEALTIFCGLGINNTLMYCELEQAIARQKVAIEMLSYHALSTQKEVESLLELRPSDDWNLTCLAFDDFSLSHDEMAIAAVKMFIDLGLVHAFRIESEVLYRMILTVKKNYRAVPYHNWRHAFSVAQTMFAMLQEEELRRLFSDQQILGIFVACFCHDLDHRGTNNAFQAKTGSALALLYGTKNTMEQHHFNHAVMILNSEGHNIFANLEPEDYSNIMCILKHAILATDLCIYFQIREKFAVLIESAEPSEIDWSQEDNLSLLRSVLMTAADLATSTKAWDVQRKAAARVTAEFFRQGDVERSKLNLVPHAQMDRERGHELPSLQVNWLQTVCLPLYKSVERVAPSLCSMREAVEINIEHWRRLVEGEEEYHWEDDLIIDFEVDKPM